MVAKTELKRTHFAGTLRSTEIGRQVTVYGWLHRKREFGSVMFLDLRDRSGIVQVVVQGELSSFEEVKRLGRESVLEVRGQVLARQDVNPDLPSGEIEIVAERVNVLAEAEVPPFFPGDHAEVSENLRLQYRYLDLRRQSMQENLAMRSKVVRTVREILEENDFMEIETPILAKATPEGARDYLVPSRVYPGRMFALPQSPQQFKQLLMVSGFERYYQIAKCFRDEDLRADRQPEFTQVDIEMSFAGPEFLYSVMEEMMARVFALKGREIPRPFRRMPYAEAMGKYGSDKPDLRIPLELIDGSQALRVLGSSIVDGVLAEGGRFVGVRLEDGSAFSRKKLDELNQKVQEWGGKGVLWVRRAEGGLKASVKAEEAALVQCAESLNLKSGGIAFFVGGKGQANQEMAGRLRLHLGRDMANPAALEFCWVTDFPLFFHNEEENRLDSNHHPFTAPRVEDLPLLEQDPLQVRSVAYDLVLNGVEVGGGSQRIHTLALQRKVFQLLKLKDEEIDDKFGFFLDAFRFGAPPHLGIALGLDRLVMLLCGLDSIRDVIPFPKTSSSMCLMSGSPSTVSRAQLDELGIRIKEE